MLTVAQGRHRARCAWLTLYAWMLLVLFDLLVLTGFARVHRYLDRRRPRSHARHDQQMTDIIWAVEEACVWYVKQAACLQRSAVATWLLRREGHDATLVIGYRPTPFESHAWVEVAGRIVNDHPQYQTHFVVLERL